MIYEKHINSIKSSSNFHYSQSYKRYKLDEFVHDQLLCVLRVTWNITLIDKDLPPLQCGIEWIDNMCILEKFLDRSLFMLESWFFFNCSLTPYYGDRFTNQIDISYRFFKKSGFAFFIIKSKNSTVDILVYVFSV